MISRHPSVRFYTGSIFRNSAVKRAGPCNQQLTEMLSCWAATNDLDGTRDCATVAKALHDCMRTAVSSSLLVQSASR
jgi:hypothetical protein